MFRQSLITGIHAEVLKIHVVDSGAHLLWSTLQCICDHLKAVAGQVAVIQAQQFDAIDLLRQNIDVLGSQFALFNLKCDYLHDQKDGLQLL